MSKKKERGGGDAVRNLRTEKGGERVIMRTESVQRKEETIRSQFLQERKGK